MIKILEAFSFLIEEHTDYRVTDLPACKQLKTNDVLVGTGLCVSTFYTLFPFRKSRQMESRSVRQSVHQSVSLVVGKWRSNVGGDISQDHCLTFSPILKTILLKCNILN